MAKKEGMGAPKRGGVNDSKQATPLYKGGSMNGPTGGPTEPARTPDPLGYLSDPGRPAPGGKPGSKLTSADNAPSSHRGRTPKDGESARRSRAPPSASRRRHVGATSSRGIHDFVGAASS